MILIAGHLTSVVLKGMSATVINVFMPCLLFSKTVPSFTSDNLGEVGVLILTSVFYQGILLLYNPIDISLRLNLCFDCPMCHAITILAIWSSFCWNLFKLGYSVLYIKLICATGDIPLAFVMTLTAAQPFTTEDQSLGIAYISIIIVWCFLTMFPFGGWMLVKRDFEIPLVPPDLEARGSGTGVHWLSRVKSVVGRRGTRAASVPPDGVRTVIHRAQPEPHELKPQIRESKLNSTILQDEDRRPSTSSITIQELDVIHPVRSLHSVHDDTELEDLSLAATPSLTRNRPFTVPTPMDPLYKRIGKKILKFLLSLISPPAIACLLSLLIALIPQLKALFVPDVPGVNMPDAPDGTPPLEWILDIATFGGILYKDSH
jgi:auxin efflux carrier family protein